MTVPEIATTLPSGLARPELVFGAPAPEPGRFAEWMSAQIRRVDADITVADEALQRFAVGDTSNIHHVMIALEKARLSFMLATQVRNKMLEGYQEIMRMQI